VLAVATGSLTVEELRSYRPDWVVEDLRRVNAVEMCGTG
jgi:hypothetical protein